MLKSASLIGFLVLVLVLVSLILRGAILGDGIFPAAIQFLCVLLMIWARVTFGRRSFHAAANPTEGGLVTTGPYRFLRHPIYASILYFLWAAVLSHISITNIFLGVIGSCGAAVRIYAEEKFLRVQYPEYSGYSAKTKRIVPYLF